MNLFGEITGTQRSGSGIISGKDRYITSNKDASELYASELIKRSGLSDQQNLYKNEIYANYSKTDSDKKDYFLEKNEKLNKMAIKLRKSFRKSYKKALQEGYSQSAAENIAQRKTNKKKEVRMQKHKAKFPF